MPSVRVFLRKTDRYLFKICKGLKKTPKIPNGKAGKEQLGSNPAPQVNQLQEQNFFATGEVGKKGKYFL